MPHSPRAVTRRRPAPAAAADRAAPPGSGAADLAARVELRPDPAAARGSALPALIRWARAVRDRERERREDGGDVATDAEDWH
jgi:hypothetical protein